MITMTAMNNVMPDSMFEIILIYKLFILISIKII